MKRISLFGSTGSIGRQTLSVIRAYPLEFKIVGLACRENWQLLLRQIKEFQPAVVAVFDQRAASQLQAKLKNKKIIVYLGPDSLEKMASFSQADMVVMAVSGAIGIKATLTAVKAKKNIALATKEVMVSAGDLVNKAVKTNKVQLIPVDSEHSAIFQCLKAGKHKEIRRIYLTCSGGPFRGQKLQDLQNVTLKQALKHPNWSMGAKITIDSATLMNKGLEVIEAMKLFHLSLAQVKVLIHPQSIIHSMVEFVDGSIIAQLGPPDMRLAVRYALAYPQRLNNNLAFLDFAKFSQLNFTQPDSQTFRCLVLAFQAAKIGGTMTAVLNGANELVVQAFLEGKIKFLAIAKCVEAVMRSHKVIKSPSLSQILKADQWARMTALKEINK